MIATVAASLVQAEEAHTSIVLPACRAQAPGGANSDGGVVAALHLLQTRRHENVSVEAAGDFPAQEGHGRSSDRLSSLVARRSCDEVPHLGEKGTQLHLVEETVAQGAHDPRARLREPCDPR